MDAENIIVRKGIINTLVATGGNVVNDAASGAYPGACIVVLNNATSPPVEVLPPILKDKIVSGKKLASQAEQTQIAIIGTDEETIVASTRYQVQVGNALEKYESRHKLIGKYSHTAPATLSGTAATDRYNVYYALMGKINADVQTKVTAYLMHKVAFTTGATAMLTIGETITQATSGATAKVAAQLVASGDITTGNAAGTLFVYDVSGSWSASSLVSTGGTSSGTVTTNAALTQGTGLVIVDDANYYAPRPYQRRGVSQVLLTAGFTTAIVEIGIATLTAGATGENIGRVGLYSRGIGSRMAQDVPTFTPEGFNVVAGEADFVLNAAPDAAKTYTTFILETNPAPSDNVLTGYSKTGQAIHVLYADESNSTYLSALETAIETALGITIP